MFSVEYSVDVRSQANVLLHHICKAGNGCIPKPPKKEGLLTSKRSKERTANVAEHAMASSSDTHGAATAEEKLARCVRACSSVSKCV